MAFKSKYKIGDRVAVMLVRKTDAMYSSDLSYTVATVSADLDEDGSYTVSFEGLWTLETLPDLFVAELVRPRTSERISLWRIVNEESSDLVDA